MATRIRLNPRTGRVEFTSRRADGRLGYLPPRRPLPQIPTALPRQRTPMDTTSVYRRAIEGGATALSKIASVALEPLHALRQGYSTSVALLRGAAEGDPLAYTRLPPTPEDETPIGTFFRAQTHPTSFMPEVPDLAQTAKAGLTAIAAAAGGGEFMGSRLGLGGEGAGLVDQTPEEQAQWEKDNPVKAYGRALAGPLVDLAIGMGTDPGMAAMMAGVGVTGRAAGEAARRAVTGMPTRPDVAARVGEWAAGRGEAARRAVLAGGEAPEMAAAVGKRVAEQAAAHAQAQLAGIATPARAAAAGSRAAGKSRLETTQALQGRLGRPVAAFGHKVAPAFIPGMVEGAVHEFGAAADIFSEEGFTPAVLRHLTGGTIDTAFAAALGIPTARKIKSRFFPRRETRTETIPFHKRRPDIVDAEFVDRGGAGPIDVGPLSRAAGAGILGEAGQRRLPPGDPQRQLPPPTRGPGEPIIPPDPAGPPAAPQPKTGLEAMDYPRLVELAAQLNRKPVHEWDSVDHTLDEAMSWELMRRYRRVTEGPEATGAPEPAPEGPPSRPDLGGLVAERLARLRGAPMAAPTRVTPLGLLQESPLTRPEPKVPGRTPVRPETGIVTPEQAGRRPVGIGPAVVPGPVVIGGGRAPLGRGEIPVGEPPAPLRPVGPGVGAGEPPEPLSPESLLNQDLSEIGREGLQARPLEELREVAAALDIPVGGKPATLADRILDVFEARKALQGATLDTLKAASNAEIGTLLKQAGLSNRGSKGVRAQRLLDWRDAARAKGAQAVGLAPETKAPESADLEPAQPADVPADRRADDRRQQEGLGPGGDERRLENRRAAIKERHPEASEELVEELATAQEQALQDQLTGLGNLRAMEADYNETIAETRSPPAVAAFDVAGLKWVNDNLSHAAGNSLLKAMGQAVAEQPGVRGFRAHGDEFFIHADTTRGAAAAALAIQQRFADAEFAYDAPDGRTLRYTGGRADFGVGGTREQADENLIRGREQAEARGERERGRPSGLVEVTPAGRDAPSEPAAEEAVAKPAAPEAEASTEPDEPLRPGTLTRNPNGTWDFAGKVPAVLAYVTKDGGPPTAEQLANAKIAGPRVAGLKPRTWKTANEAIDAAREAGYEPSAADLRLRNQEVRELEKEAEIKASAEDVPRDTVTASPEPEPPKSAPAPAEAEKLLADAYEAERLSRGGLRSGLIAQTWRRLQKMDAPLSLEDYHALLKRLHGEGRVGLAVHDVKASIPAEDLPLLPKREDGWPYFYYTPYDLAKAGPDPPETQEPSQLERVETGDRIGDLTVGERIDNTGSIAGEFNEGEYEVLGTRRVPLDAFEVTAPRDLYDAVDDIRRVDELAAEIRESGRIDPLIVAYDTPGRGPYVIEGGHRLAALHTLGAKELPALVVDARAAAEPEPPKPGDVVTRAHPILQEFDALAQGKPGGAPVTTEMRSRFNLPLNVKTIAAARALVTERTSAGSIPAAGPAELEPQKPGEPTPAQLEAGNFPKLHRRWQGFGVSIETAKGQIRKSKPGRPPWQVEMPADYGHILGTKGADGEQIDILLGESPNAEKVWIVDQVDPATGKFNEHKILADFALAGEAQRAYEGVFSDGSGPDRIGGITEMSIPEFKEWLATGDHTKAVGVLSKRPEPTLGEEAVDVRKQPESEDRGALAEVPPEDVRLPEEPGAPGAEGGGGRRPDDGRAGGVDEGGEGAPVRPGVGGGEGGVGVPPERVGQSERAPVARQPGGGSDYRISETDALGSGGLKTKARANLDAIRTLKAIEAEGRAATPEEQATLVKYAGWGGMPQVFEAKVRDEWKGTREELDQLLTPEEFAAARASTPNAHYTSELVVRQMWEAAKRLGLGRGASVLEPSMGVGHFFGLTPADLLPAKRTGVELDSITGRIAKALYPEANIRVSGLQEAPVPSDYFDLAISNVPFGNYAVHDPKIPKELRTSIHDYFFAKAVEVVRPGGVVAFITSSYTMDKKATKVREALAGRADLLGAIRLPNTAFKASAGTEVTTDIIFLRKRVPGEQPAGEAWTQLAEHQGGDGKKQRINEYFAAHPEMMLGTMTLRGTMHGGEEPTLEGKLSEDALQAAIARLPADSFRAWKAEAKDDTVSVLDVPDGAAIKEGAFGLREGAIVVREGSLFRPVKLPAKAAERVTGMIGIRGALRSVFQTQLKGATDAEVEAARAELNRAYDRYVKKHGPLWNRENRRAFAGDPDAPALLALENFDETTGKATKTDIFSKRTIQRYQPPATAEGAPEAMSISLAEYGRVDWARMQGLTGKTPDQLRADLGDTIFKDHETGEWVTREEYLSGNVRQKLDVARAAARKDKTLQRNVKALEEVQPATVEYVDIDVRLGAPWVPRDVYLQFLEEVLGVRPNRVKELKYAPSLARWNLRVEGHGGIGDTETFGTEDYHGHELMEAALNLRQPTVYRTENQAKVLDPAATAAAREKLDQLHERFQEWLFENDSRRKLMVERYNDIHNNLQLREYDGSHLRFPGMARETLRGGDLSPHQKNAVWRIVNGGNTLLAHAVGAGKTFEMIAAGMELKRMGLVRKPMYVVPPNLVEQWGSEFLRLYPSANILVAGPESFNQGKRQRMMSRIATGNYDAVIVGHSSFERLPVSEDLYGDYIGEQIADLERNIIEAKAESGTSRSIVKELEKAKQRLEAKLAERLKAEKKDTTLTFEELGVDQLFIDEAHYFKNLMFGTKLRNVAGISTSDSGRATDMHIKTRYVTRLHGGKRGVVFATATPVSNTMAEMFNLHRYLREQQLRDSGLGHFDAWAQTFGRTVTAMELAPEGKGFRPRTRFGRFANLPEMLASFREFSDVKTAEDLKLPIPEIHGGVPAVSIAPSTPDIEAYVESLGARAEAVRGGSVDPRDDNMLKITSDGKKAALDMRLVQPWAIDHPDSKVNQAVQRIYDIWKAGKSEKTTQLVFSDLSVPLKKGKTGFSVYNDMQQKLVARGVPEKEIAFAQTAETTAQKQALFNKVNKGQVRILFGSTLKLGVGANVQRRLIAAHHLDAPWRPADVEQRDGRILRQGNPHKVVQVIRYVTEKSFDGYLWQTLENKAKFINDAMTSKLTQRTAEDVDGGALNAAEVKALATGNPRILEKVQLDAELGRLLSLRTSFARQRALQERKLEWIPGRRDAVLEHIEQGKADIKTRDANTPKDGSFEALVGGQHAVGETARAVAGEVLAQKGEEYRKLPVEVSAPLGSFRGLKIVVSGGSDWRTGFTLVGRGSYSFYYNESAIGIVRSMEHASASIEAWVEHLKQELVDLAEQDAGLKSELEKKFTKGPEIEKLKAKIAEIDKELDLSRVREGGALDPIPSGGLGGSEPPKPPPKAAQGAAELPPEDRAGLGSAAERARERIRQRGKDKSVNDLGSAGAQGAASLFDFSVIGAEWIARGFKRFGAWTGKMLGEFGRGIRRFLRMLWNQSRNVFRRSTRLEEPAAAAGGPRGPNLHPDGMPRPTAEQPRGYTIPVETRAEAFIRNIQDQWNRMKGVHAEVKRQGGRANDASDVYAFEEVFPGRTENRMKGFKLKHVDPLMKEIRDAGLTLEEVGEYLYAKHAAARNARMERINPEIGEAGSGMSNAEAAKILDGFRASGKAEGLEAAAKRVRAMLKLQREIIVEYKLETPETMAAWEAAFGPDYVPLRSFEVDNPTTLGTGKGFQVRGKEAQHATGRRSKAENPLLFSIAQVYQTIVRAEKARVGHSFLRFVRENPDPGNWKLHTERPTRSTIGPDGKVRKVVDWQFTEKDNVFTIKELGKDYYIEVSPHLQQITRALKKLGANNLNQAMKWASASTRLYSAMQTSWSIPFLLTNPARDIQAAFANLTAEKSAGVAKRVVKDAPAALRAMYRSLRGKAGQKPKDAEWDRFAEEFQADGGSVGFYGLKGVEELLRELQGQVSKPNRPRTAARILRAIGKWVEDANKAIENALRLSTYVHLRREGVTRQKAAQWGKNVSVNFNRKGELGSSINAVYAFSNASIQGTARLAQVLRTARGKRIATGILAAGYILDTYNRSIAGDDDGDEVNDYDAIPDYVKERNWILMTGEGNPPIMFPMPYGFNVIHHAGQMASAVVGGGRKPTEAIGSVWNAAMGSFNPTGSEADVVQQLSPTLLDPVVQLAMNRNFAGIPIKPEQFAFAPDKPQSELYFSTVSPASLGLARRLNQATGGDAVTAGWVDISPETIDHVMAFLGGGMGRFVSRSTDLGYGLAHGETPAIRKTPVLRRFIYDPHPGEIRSRYYENLEELRMAEHRFDHYIQQRDLAKAREIPRSMLAAKRAVDKIDAIIKRLRKAGIPNEDPRIERLRIQAISIVERARARAIG